MKAPDEVVEAVAKKVARDWAKALVDPDEAQAWPRSFTIGSPSKTDVSDGFADTYRSVLDAWADWKKTRCGARVQVEFRRRKVGRLTIPFPARVIIDDIDAAAELVGGQWPDTIAVGRRRYATLTADEVPGTMSPGLLRAVTDLSDVDFDLLRTTVQWWIDNAPVTGLTARQVPVRGLHAKWLDKHGSLVRSLAGLDTLGLVNRPNRLNITYLDTQWLHEGGRHRDSLATDDPVAALPYRPQVILITENRDTALFFRAVPGALAVEGVGDAITKRLGEFDWFAECPLVVYWGDIDADGYEIVNALREMRPVTTMLMDTDTYRAYRDYGVRVDQHGRSLRPVRKDLPFLSEQEREVYEIVTDASHEGPLRIEQERVPLPVAAAALRETIEGRAISAG